ncbi:hypothetical protein Sjap_004551 [Stephania japonica]|uniref:Uncharacterized protein n=1 Tax=Stephania japonica TaxID=461633 RepID=A0AAP0K3Y7_9MAGN
MDGDRGAPSRYEVSFSTTHHHHPHHPPITILHDMGFAAHHFDQDQNHQGLSFLLPSSHHHPHHNSHVVSLPFDVISGATISPASTAAIATTATSNVDTVGIRSGNDNIDVASTNKASWNNVDQVSRIIWIQKLLARRTAPLVEELSREKQGEGEEEAKRTKVLLPNSKRHRRTR